LGVGTIQRSTISLTVDESKAISWAKFNVRLTRQYEPDGSMSS